MISIKCPHCGKAYTISTEHAKKKKHAVCAKCNQRFSILTNVIPRIEPTPAPDPIAKRPWTLPAAILAGSLCVASAIVFYTYRTSHQDVVTASQPHADSALEQPKARGDASPPNKKIPSPPAQMVKRKDDIDLAPMSVHATLEDVISTAEKSVCMVSHEAGSGTGFVVDQTKGWIVTNFHVIESSGLTDIVVTFLSNRAQRERANVISFDTANDLAILASKSARSVKALPFGNPVAIRKGEDILVIGSPGLGDTLVSTNSVTRGIVSNNRIAVAGRELIQIDAPINPGNSGGPLLDAKGRVIGIVTLKISNKEGMGFAVPIDKVRALMDLPPRKEDAEKLVANNQISTAYGMMVILDSKIVDCFVDIEKHWKAAIASNEDMSAAVLSAIEPYDQFLKKGTEQLQGIRKTLSGLRTSKSVDSVLIHDLEQYSQLLQEFFDYALSPTGNYKAFEGKWPSTLKRMREFREQLEQKVKKSAIRQ